jgi:LysR family transcriptional regulator for bpeEF and oprC
MDRLKAMQTFVRIVEANSFTKAAETLNLPRAALTATMQNLEAFLGTTLLQRTTRRLSLTPDGADYFQKCLEILAAIEAAETTFRGAQAQRPKGRLRVALPGTLGRTVVLPQIARFCAAYPEVEPILSLSDQVVDLTREAIDCSLRVGQLQDSAFIGRQIGTMRFMICAAPSYLAQYGTPVQLDELAAHRCIAHFSGRTGRAFDWDLQHGAQVVRVEMRAAIAVNEADANISCALQGLGLAQLAVYQARPHLDSGALLEVLPAYSPTPMPVSLLYPQGRMGSSKVRAFADWLTALMRSIPDLQS